MDDDILTTELPHPLTVGLSTFSKENLVEAYRRFFQVDSNALKLLLEYGEELNELLLSIREVLNDNNADRVFIGGCGASGRVALLLESVWRSVVKAYPSRALIERVVGFVAAGDVALVRSIDGLEDVASNGEAELSRLGFRNGDMFIGLNASGKTPLVLGAVLFAPTRSPKRQHWILGNNPAAELSRVPAVKELLECGAPGVRVLCQCVGPMALAGSTRLQAGTAQALFTGLALLAAADPSVSFTREIHALLARLGELDLDQLSALTRHESDIWCSGSLVTYLVAPEWSLTALSDISERSPTFSEPPLERCTDSSPATWSRCAVAVGGATGSVEAWRLALNRELRTTPEGSSTSTPIPNENSDTLRPCDFDFSEASLQRRSQMSGHQTIRLESEQIKNGCAIVFRFGLNNLVINLCGLHSLTQQVLIDILVCGFD